MGSFNYTGAFSKLPIHDGERTVALIGFYNKNIDSPDEFAPGHKFTPIALPIRGTYNGYGYIENIDDTPSAKYISKFFDNDIEYILETIREGGSIVEEWTNKVINKVQNENTQHKHFNLTSEAYKLIKEHVGEEKLMDVVLAFSKITRDAEALQNININSIKEDCISKEKSKYTIVMILEHEFVFDKLVSIGDTSYADHNFWQTPEDILIKLGYTPIHKGLSERHYKLADYVKEGYPTLTRDCYIWPIEDVHNYSCTMHSMSDIANFVGMEVEEQYKIPYLEYCFMKSITNKNNETDEWDFNEYTSFRKYPKQINVHHSVYHFNEYWSTDYIFGIYTDDTLLVEENCKDAAAIQSLIMAMVKNDIVWGFSNYSGECKDHTKLAELYQSYADYLNKYVEDKKKENDED